MMRGWGTGMLTLAGCPSGATAERPCNELGFQRAVQASLWGLPTVEMAKRQKAPEDIFKAGVNDSVTYFDSKQKQGILAVTTEVT